MAYLLGSWALDRLGASTGPLGLWGLLGGLIVLVLATAIPYVGWLLWAAATVLGVGAALLTGRGAAAAAAQPAN